MEDPISPLNAQYRWVAVQWGVTSSLLKITSMLTGFYTLTFVLADAELVDNFLLFTALTMAVTATVIVVIGRAAAQQVGLMQNPILAEALVRRTVCVVRSFVALSLGFLLARFARPFFQLPGSGPSANEPQLLEASAIAVLAVAVVAVLWFQRWVATVSQLPPHPTRDCFFKCNRRWLWRCCRRPARRCGIWATESACIPCCCWYPTAAVAARLVRSTNCCTAVGRYMIAEEVNIISALLGTAAENYRQAVQHAEDYMDWLTTAASHDPEARSSTWLRLPQIIAWTKTATPQGGVSWLVSGCVTLTGTGAAAGDAPRSFRIPPQGLWLQRVRDAPDDKLRVRHLPRSCLPLSQPMDDATGQALQITCAIAATADPLSKLAARAAAPTSHITFHGKSLDAPAEDFAGYRMSAIPSRLSADPTKAMIRVRVLTNWDLQRLLPSMPSDPLAQWHLAGQQMDECVLHMTIAAKAREQAKRLWDRLKTHLTRVGDDSIAWTVPAPPGSTEPVHLHSGHGIPLVLPNVALANGGGARDVRSLVVRAALIAGRAVIAVDQADADVTTVLNTIHALAGPKVPTLAAGFDAAAPAAVVGAAAAAGVAGAAATAAGVAVADAAAFAAANAAAEAAANSAVAAAAAATAAQSPAREAAAVVARAATRAAAIAAAAAAPAAAATAAAAAAPSADAIAATIAKATSEAAATTSRRAETAAATAATNAATVAATAAAPAAVATAAAAAAARAAASAVASETAAAAVMAAAHAPLAAIALSRASQLSTLRDIAARLADRDHLVLESIQHARDAAEEASQACRHVQAALALVHAFERLRGHDIDGAEGIAKDWTVQLALPGDAAANNPA